jgi:hypothetical protein
MFGREAAPNLAAHLMGAIHITDRADRHVFGGAGLT